MKQLLLFMAAILAITGCRTIDDTIYVQDARIEAPVMQPPLNMPINEGVTFQIIPSMVLNKSVSQINGRIEGHSKVNHNGIFAVDTSVYQDMSVRYRESGNSTEFKGKNLQWITSDFTIGADVEIKTSGSMVLSGGFRAAGAGDDILNAWRAGIGFSSIKEGTGVRFDAGLIWQENIYEINSAVVRTVSGYWTDDENTEEVFFTSDRGKSYNLGYYFAFTLSTHNHIINPFLNISISGQKILDYKPERLTERYAYNPNTLKLKTDESMTETILLWGVTPGISTDILGVYRLTAGLRMIWPTGIEESNVKLFVMPVLQIGLNL